MDLFPSTISDEIKLLISEYGLDPWLLNNENETPFDTIENSDTYNEILNIWTKQIYYTILSNDTNTTSKYPFFTTIFDKIKNNFDDMNTLFDIIDSYI